MRIIYVFLGGGLGSVARYLTAVGAARVISPSFPFGTLLVNVVGCFFIGFVHGFAMRTTRVPPDIRLFLTTGVMGGLTTYSAFNYETLTMMGQGSAGRASVYVLAMLVGCGGAGLLGAWAADRAASFV